MLRYRYMGLIFLLATCLYLIFEDYKNSSQSQGSTRDLTHVEGLEGGFGGEEKQSISLPIYQNQTEVK